MASEKTAAAAEREEAGSKKGWRFSRSKKLEQDLAHVNREIYSRNLELAQTNKTLALLQAIDNLVLSIEGENKQLSTRLAAEVVKAGEYPFVAILGYAQHDQSHLEMYGWASSKQLPSDKAAMADNLCIKADLDWLKKDEVLKLVNLTAKTDTQLTYYCKRPEESAQPLGATLPLKSACCIKLGARKDLVGVMIIGFDEERDEISIFEQSLFARLSDAVGIAIDHKLLLEENERVLDQLEKSNAKLRLLDKTKDDFISMASHQLRTPLTSVKGYVSMILDGDAGHISPTQRKLLTQSFLSSQRMAYLISDLLNVSRLRTGKFVIDPVPCNLSKVIEEEMSQLTETIKARGLEMTYHKPENFPTLMLDEIKLRQVIMNFVDNAIYYTPSGGHIDIYLVDKPESVEFTVVDNGIGVPKDDQHRLFSKFYRAQNAMQARPDGTGLGIFMAKKVIIAQGGAVIFKSAVNKGSTFGFTFPKDKLKQPLPSADQATPKTQQVAEPKAS